jgi:CubicO group peptidase (beta-lactamase class C family)
MRPSPSHLLAAVGAFAALHAGLAPADEKKAPDLNKVVADELEAARAKHKLPAMGAAVVNSKGVRALAVVGVRKHGAPQKATADDLWHLGSDTKPITAALIALLVEEGKLSYDLRMDKAFPEMAAKMHESCKGITLAQLLTHHAGLPANLEGGWWQMVGKGTVTQQRAESARLALGKKPEIEPGKKFQYSNLGYVIAAGLAERATKQSWEELLRARVFKPLKMTSAGFGPPGRKGAVDQPWPHKDDGKPVAPGPFADNPPVMGPAGTVHCSLRDWAKFVQDELAGVRGEKRAGALLRPGSYQKLATSPYPDWFYTLGGWAGAPKGKKRGLVLAHEGSNTMNFASAIVLPERDLAVLVVTNQGGPGGPGGKGAHAALFALLKRLEK